MIMKNSIEVFNKQGQLDRTFNEDQSDDNADFAEKAKEYAEKKGFTLNKPGNVLEPADPMSVPQADLGAGLGAGEETVKPKGKGKGKVKK